MIGLLTALLVLEKKYNFNVSFEPKLLYCMKAS